MKNYKTNIEKNKTYIIKDFSFIELSEILPGNIVNFKSDCELFSNFDVTGKVTNISVGNINEILINVKTKRRNLTIGSNMSNLSFILV